jgi:hypothetical protein
MDVTVKIRFNASKQNFEKFGRDKYLAYLPFPEDEDSKSIIIFILSRQLGVPPSKITFKGLDYNKDWVFQVF